MRRKLSRREIDRLENLLILLLVCLALFLIHRTGMFQSVRGAEQGTRVSLRGFRIPPCPGEPRCA